MLTGADRKRFVVLELPFNDAVRLALWSELNGPAVTLKEAEVADAGNTTEDGTTRAEEPAVTATAVLLETGAPTVTEQLVVMPGVRVLAAQASAVSPTGAAETLPPVAVTPTGSPAGETAAGLLTPIEALPAPAASATETFARSPFPMVLVFNPLATQVYIPAPPVQSRVFPAVARTGPAVTATLVMVDG